MGVKDGVFVPLMEQLMFVWADGSSTPMLTRTWKRKIPVPGIVIPPKSAVLSVQARRKTSPVVELAAPPALIVSGEAKLS
jgi:hypothetical protein